MKRHAFDRLVLGIASLGCVGAWALPQSSACAQERYNEIDSPDAESQCGSTWDVQDVESYDGSLGVSTDWVKQHESAVGFHVDVGCSGTLIDRDLFLSAGHCDYWVGDTVRFDHQYDASGTKRSPRDFTVTEIVEQEYDGEGSEWDYSIVRLSGSPGDVYGYAQPLPALVFTRIAIIQHPLGEPKVISTGEILRGSSALGGNWFPHNADTERGSSGAGVLSTEGYLVGIHTNGGCNPRMPEKTNHATSIAALVRYSPTLNSLANPAGFTSVFFTKSVSGDDRREITASALDIKGDSVRCRVGEAVCSFLVPNGSMDLQMRTRGTCGEIRFSRLEDDGLVIDSIHPFGREETFRATLPLTGTPVWVITNTSSDC